MGYKIGVPSLKLNNTGTRSKHCGSFGGVAYEALKERKGQDIDIDPERSKDNVYTGYQTAAELMEYSQRHLKELKDASGRGIRKDAVAMCATVFKPPAAYMNALSVEARNRFFDDCLAFLEDYVGAANIKSTALHRDERGDHLHVFWEPMTKDGRLCAKEMHNIKFFAYVNEHLPAYLRERGWEIDNADCYDRAQREREDAEAEEERYQKRQKQGRSSAAYKLDAERERQALQRENDELRASNSRLTGELEVKKIEMADIEGELTALCQIKTMAERDEVAAAAWSQLDELDAAFDAADAFCDTAEQEIERGGFNLRGVVQDFIFDWRRIRERVFGLVDSIKEKIRNISIFERLRHVRPENQVAGALQKSLDAKLAGARSQVVEAGHPASKESTMDAR